MKETLAAQLFAALTDKEVARFGKFLRSPYFNQREDVQALHRILVENRRHGLDGLEKERVFEAVYAGKSFERAPFNYLLTFYAERLEQFLACEELMQDALQNRLLRCRAFRRRGLYEHFDANARELVRDHAAVPHRNAGWWLFEYQLQNEIFSREVIRQRGGQPARAEDATRALTNFFLFENLRWSGMRSVQAALSREAQPPVPLSAEAMRAALDTPEAENPALALVQAGATALASPDDEAAFRRLKNLLHAHRNLFPPDECRDLFMPAINFAIRRHNRGDRAYTHEAFELYREAWEAGLLPENGILPKYTYVNMLNLAQLVGEHAWARQFLDAGRDFLPPDDRDATHRYALAGFHFRRSEYQTVLQLLREVEFGEVFINLDVRKMLLRSYFELGEWVALASLLDSFKAYLRRQKDLGYHRESYLNLVKFTQKLAKTTGKHGAKRRVLAEKIRAAAAVAEREWLLSKA